jgi:hypothetical protein
MTNLFDWKIYIENEYIATCKYAVDAAMIIANCQPGSTIRYGHHKIVWTEGQEDQPAGESFDHVAEVCISRIINSCNYKTV